MKSFIKKIKHCLKNIKIRILSVFLFLLLLCLWYLFLSPYKDLSVFLGKNRSVRLYDAKQNLLQITSVEGGIHNEWHNLSEIPLEVSISFLLTEDSNFYSHFGVDIKAVLRAAFQNVSSRREVSGASTITMQLARIITKRNGNRFLSKIAESFNALRLEARFSKNQIFEMYLNSVPFGLQIEGVTSACRTFFSKDIADISFSEAFCLAVIPRRPSAYNLLEHKDECIEKAKMLYSQLDFKNLDRLCRKVAKNKTVSSSAALQITTPVWNQVSFSVKKFQYPYNMMHFAQYVINERQKSHARDNVLKSNLPAEMILSVDYSFQKYMQKELRQSIEKNRSSRITNGAVIAIDNMSGNILCWVGSGDFFNDENNGQIDGVTVKRQPGSSMKPFLYAMALDKGIKPNEVLKDIPLTFGNEEIYVPLNFNNRFNGPVRFRVALGSSLNVPAVDLLYRLGINNYLKVLDELGFDSLKEDSRNQGLSLALGSGEVTLKELTEAFTVFANDGKKVFTKYELNEKKKLSEQIFSSDSCRIIADILSDKDARILGFRSANVFNLPFPTMFKTGTANQFQTITALASTPFYTVGVWMGNFSGDTVIGKTGSSVPALIAKKALTYLQKNQQVDFKQPENYRKEKVCAISGKRPGKGCLNIVEEYIKFDDSFDFCDYHDDFGNVNYPSEYERWFLTQDRNGSINYRDSSLEIVSPRMGSVYIYDNSFAQDKNVIILEVTGGQEDILLVQYDNEEPFTVSRPFKCSFDVVKGEHRIKVTCKNETKETCFFVE